MEDQPEVVIKYDETKKRKCTKCNKRKEPKLFQDSISFRKDGTKVVGKKGACIKCTNDYRNSFLKDQPRLRAIYHYRGALKVLEKYGITPEEAMKYKSSRFKNSTGDKK